MIGLRECWEDTRPPEASGSVGEFWRHVSYMALMHVLSYGDLAWVDGFEEAKQQASAFDEAAARETPGVILQAEELFRSTDHKPTS